MASKKDIRARELANAIADGYWLAKDHGRWFVGRGSGSETRVITSAGYPSKEHARDRMLELHRGTTVGAPVVYPPRPSVLKP